MMDHPKITKARFPELDALRGIAALQVLLFHYAMNYIDKPVYSVFKYGISGVDLFFIISGFVIFMSVAHVKSGTEFLINRVSRLYPTYWAVLIFTLLAFHVNENLVNGEAHPMDWELFWYNMTMFHYYANIADMDGPYWTMIIEMVFYLVMFLLLVTKSLRSTIPFFVLLVLTGMVVTEFYRGYGLELYTDYLANFPLSQFMPLFLAGILFYHIIHVPEKKWWYIVLIVGCYLAQVLLYGHGGRSFWVISYAEYKSVLGVYFILMFLFVFGKLKWIVNRYTLFLGKISFALYLVHQYVSVWCIIPGLMKIGVNYYVAAYLIALPFCLLVATLITYTVERPLSPKFRTLLHDLFLIRLPAFLKRFSPPQKNSIL